MIAEFFADLAMNIAIWIASLFPAWELPAWVTDSRGAFIALIEGYTGLGVWIDWAVLGLCATAVSIVVATMLIIKIARAAVAHIPFVGGKGD